MSDPIRVDPADDAAARIALTDEIVERYGLDPWKDEFWLMTAGYRDRLDPDDAASPEVPFNSLTVAIMAEARARILERSLPAGEQVVLHVGGEVRFHTQTFIRVVSRVYAAHGFRIQLRRGAATTPIWYSSFGILHRELHGGDNFTASHSPYFKGGWKPIGPEGKQLLEEEEAIVEEVRRIVERREGIELTPFEGNPLITHDFDADDAYVEYQRSLMGSELLDGIGQAAKLGFRCRASSLGGSMMRTSEALFEKLGVPTGEGGVVSYFLSEESPRYHGLGEVGDKHFGSDPGDPRIYREIGAREALLSGKASLVLLWDPDGDRLKLVSVAPRAVEELARSVALEVDEECSSDQCVVYFSPNQLYLMLVAYRIDSMRASGELSAHDWFIGASLPTSSSLQELAEAEGVRMVHVGVGFKHIGDLCEQVERRLGGPVSIEAITGRRVDLGRSPRALLLCEESGGASLGGPELMRSCTGARSILGLREKDGMQIGLLALALGAGLYRAGSSFVEYYARVVERHRIRHLHYVRRDVRLYEENLAGAELLAAREQGLERRDRVMRFFRELALDHARGRRSLASTREALEGRAREPGRRMPELSAAYVAGDGIVLEGTSFRFILRSSGTDALLRYYLEGESPGDVQELDDLLTTLEIP